MNLRKIMLLLVALLGLLVVTDGFALVRKGLFPQAPGVVSYTYRKQFAKDVPGTLDLIKSLGITDIEFSNLFGQTAPGLRKLLDERGLKCSSFGVSYNDLVQKTGEVASNAKALGAQYVRVASIPHQAPFTLEQAKKAIDDFNRVGKILKEEHGLSFVYHNHGFEFEPYQNGTLYDLMMEQTDPRYVNFELDMLWAFFPGQDPAALLKKYGKRYKLMHLKDLQKGVAGNLSGSTSPEHDVPLGTGQLDVPAILAAARKAGVKHYYIEDESSRVEVQVPQSMAFLKGLK